MTAHPPTPEQQAAIDLFATGTNLVIKAGAGTGRPVGGFPGYAVTTEGEVWTFWRRNGRHPRVLTSTPQARLRPGIAGANGYEQVWLYRDGARRGRFVHVLVLEAFVGTCPPGLQARHLNGVERDNRLSNLAWGTRAENMADRDAHATTARGAKVGTSVLSESDVREIRAAVARGEALRATARRFSISHRQVGRIVSGEAWSHEAQAAEAGA